MFYLTNVHTCVFFFLFLVDVLFQRGIVFFGGFKSTQLARQVQQEPVQMEVQW